MQSKSIEFVLRKRHFESTKFTVAQKIGAFLQVFRPLVGIHSFEM